MILGGLQKTTLVDFPPFLACTVFTVGCNFRCHFCYNKDLVTAKRFSASNRKLVHEDEFFSFLKQRKGILDGVCITGGEPTMQRDLMNFCKKIKALGFKVKLDTNGSNPEALQDLIEKKLVDFIAMDIKNCFRKYSQTTNSCIDIKKIKRSIRLIVNSNIDFEFRTTVVPTLHSKDSLVEQAKDLREELRLAGKDSKELVFVLQAFRAGNCLDKNFNSVQPLSSYEMQGFLEEVKKILPQAALRNS